MLCRGARVPRADCQRWPAGKSGGMLDQALFGEAAGSVGWPVIPGFGGTKGGPGAKGGERKMSWHLRERLRLPCEEQRSPSAQDASVSYIERSLSKLRRSEMRIHWRREGPPEQLCAP